MKFLLFSFICLFGFSGFSQKLDNYYTSLTSEDGRLYFIEPFKGFKSQSKNDFIYDITAHTRKDSVIFNFCYFDEEIYKFDNISFLATNSFSSKLDIIFIETKKNKMHYRFTTKLAYNDLKIFFNEETPKIILATNENKIIIQAKNRKWKKMSNIMRKIFAMIDLNR